MVRADDENGAAPLPSGSVQDGSDILLSKIQGVDLDAGLKRVAGNKRLYRSLLEQFTRKYGGASAEIDAALKSGDRTLANRIAHTVKGVAGNLGITPVQSAAESIELAIRNEDASVERRLDELLDRWNNT